MLKWVNEFLKENHERWEKERENREKEIEKELEDWDRTKRHEKLRILKEKMNNKNVAKLEELEKQEKEKWTVWQDRGKLEDRIDLPVPPGARISPRRQSEETLGGIYCKETKNNNKTDNKTKSRTINEYLIKKPRLEFQWEVGENNMSLPVPKELQSQIGTNEGSLPVPKEVEKGNENLPEKPHEKTPPPLKISPKTQFPQSPNIPSQILDEKNPPRTPENSRITSPSDQMGQPDDNLQSVEGIAKGLPPIQVHSSVNDLDEGHLGGVTIRGGAVTSPNPPI